MFGLWPWRAAQASHCSTPSALHSGRVGRAWEGLRDQLWEEGSGSRLPQKTVTLSVNTFTKNTGRAKPLLLHHVRWGAGSSEFGAWRCGCPATGSLCETWQVHFPLCICSCKQLVLMWKSQKITRVDKRGNQNYKAVISMTKVD